MQLQEMPVPETLNTEAKTKAMATTFLLPETL